MCYLRRDKNINVVFFLFIFEYIKRELKRRHICGCRCNERLELKPCDLSSCLLFSSTASLSLFAAEEKGESRGKCHASHTVFSLFFPFLFFSPSHKEQKSSNWNRKEGRHKGAYERGWRGHPDEGKPPVSLLSCCVCVCRSRQSQFHNDKTEGASDGRFKEGLVQGEGMHGCC